MHLNVLMRDEKEERKKQARSNKQTKQSNTAHPRQSLFLEKMSCLGWDSNPRHSRQSALPTELPRQLSWLGPNLNVHVYVDVEGSHSRPGKVASPSFTHTQFLVTGKHFTIHLLFQTGVADV